MTSICERGGTLLVSDDGDIQAWLPLGGDCNWREISWRSNNYPALRVSDVTATKAEIASFIKRNYVGWLIRKVNLAGITTDADGRITDHAGITP